PALPHRSLRRLVPPAALRRSVDCLISVLVRTVVALALRLPINHLFRVSGRVTVAPVVRRPLRRLTCVPGCTGGCLSTSDLPQRFNAANSLHGANRGRRERGRPHYLYNEPVAARRGAGQVGNRILRYDPSAVDNGDARTDHADLGQNVRR